MRKRVIGIVALGVCAACSDPSMYSALGQSIGTPALIAGIGDLAQPRFASTQGLYLTVTDGGQPSLVFLVTARSLEAEPVSYRPPPPGAPSMPTTIGMAVLNAFVIPDDDSSGGSVDGQKQVAAFLSQATDLLAPGTGIFFFRDTTQAFVKDIATGDNFLVSADPDGFPANSNVTSVVVSGSGRFVAFATRATNLVRPVNPIEAPNGASQVYVLDLVTGVLDVVSATSAGAPGTGDSLDPVISPNGRYVAFRSHAPNLTGDGTNSTILLYDRSKMVMTPVSVDTVAPKMYVDAAEPALSQDGLLVAFTAVDPVAGGPRQVWMRDVSKGAVWLVSGNPSKGDADSESPSITPDGHFVAFASKSSNLGGYFDPMGFSDVFVYKNNMDGTGELRQVSIDLDGTSNGNGDSTQPSLSPDGSYIAYISRATNVAVDDPDRVDGEANGLADLILGPQPFGD